MLSLWANWLVTKFGLNSLKRYLWPVLYHVTSLLFCLSPGISFLLMTGTNDHSNSKVTMLNVILRLCFSRPGCPVAIIYLHLEVLDQFFSNLRASACTELYTLPAANEMKDDCNENGKGIIDFPLIKEDIVSGVIRPCNSIFGENYFFI